MTELKDRYTFDELVQILRELRGEPGCPWDKVQTYESIMDCLANETQEVREAIEKKDYDNLCEELGDVLLQVVFYAQMASEDGYFTIDDVIRGICRKMIRRHPHIYGDAVAHTPEEALALFRQVKAMERAGLLK